MTVKASLSKHLTSVSWSTPDQICIGTDVVGGSSAGVRNKSVTMELNTHTPMGRMVLSIMATFAQFERDRNLERTIEDTGAGGGDRLANAAHLVGRKIVHDDDIAR